MRPSTGYWRRIALPKIDAEADEAEYRWALPRVLASFGVTNQNQKVIPRYRTSQPPSTANGKAKEEIRKPPATLTAGDQTCLYGNRYRAAWPPWVDAAQARGIADKQGS